MSDPFLMPRHFCAKNLEGLTRVYLYSDVVPLIQLVRANDKKLRDKNKQLQQISQELLEALYYAHGNMGAASNEEIKQRIRTAITNAKQVTGDSDE